MLAQRTAVTAALLVRGQRLVRHINSNPMRSQSPILLHKPLETLSHLLDNSKQEHEVFVEDLISKIVANPTNERARREVAAEARAAGVYDFRNSSNAQLQRQTRKLMALLGWADLAERKGNYGIRVLAIDGGGTKALIAIEILKRLEEMTGKRTHEMFDLIGGCSTGAILAYALGVRHMPLQDVEEMYRKLSKNVFEVGKMQGGSRVLRGGSYYDTSVLENIIKTNFGEGSLIDTAADPTVPKIFANSSLTDRSQSTPFIFRNYNLPIREESRYPGSCHAKVWEALRATTAAPGYFDDIVVGGQSHQDGSLLANNPTAIAIHEAKRIWGRNVKFEAVVSLGTGKYRQANVDGKDRASWLGVAQMVINSATDSKGVHRILQDMLPEYTYFRFNPFVTEPYLNEYRNDKLEQYKTDAKIYLRDHKADIERCVKTLLQKRDLYNRFKDFLYSHPFVCSVVSSVYFPICKLFFKKATSRT